MTTIPLKPFTSLNQTICLTLTALTTQSQFASMLASYFVNVEAPDKEFEIFTGDLAEHISALHFHPEKCLVVMGDESSAYAQFVTSKETFEQLFAGYEECAYSVRLEREIVVNLNPTEMKVALGFG